MKSLLIPVGILIGASLLILSSVSHHIFILQLWWILAGAALVFLSFFLDWRAILNHRWFIWAFYVLSALLLVVTLFSPPIRNVHSWLIIGPFQFQTVELMKIALIFVYATYFSRRHLAIARLKHIFTSFILFAIPAALVLMQPDLGYTTVLFGIWAGFLLVSGLPKKRILTGVLIFAVLGIIGWSHFLKPYQKERIVGIFYPEKNVLGINYQQAQSKIAIGSGGFSGKGYGQGTQIQLGFLTEPGTDFVLASLIEEWGVAMGLVVIGAFSWLVFGILKVGMNSNQNFEKFICAGTAIVFGLQFIINAGTALGVVPVVGLPFPFLSYGGSSLLTNFFLLSIIVGIEHRS